MNEETADIKREIFSWVANKVESVETWTVAEVPLFIQEFLTWRFYESLITTITSMFPMALTIILFGFWVRKYKKDGGFRNDFKSNADSWAVGSFAITMVFFVVSLLFFFVGVVGNVKEMIQIKIAPRVYLVEEAAKLIKE